MKRARGEKIVIVLGGDLTEIFRKDEEGELHLVAHEAGIDNGLILHLGAVKIANAFGIPVERELRKLRGKFDG